MTPIYHYELDGTLIEETLENFLIHFQSEQFWQNDVYIQAASSNRFFFSEEVARKQLMERLNNSKRLNILRIKQLQIENNKIDELMISFG